MKPLPDKFPEFELVQAGHVWLVGAGPGDPRLLTLMALNAIRSADAIVHDALVDKRILTLAGADAKIIFAGKRGGMASSTQPEITQTIIDLAQTGHRVVRLKGGDPFVFGRGGEEAAALVRAGIPYRVVPGITAGLAGSALAGIPATTRDTNHAVILATGHRAPDDGNGGGKGEDWHALARTGQPIILYMAIKRLTEITNALVEGGLALGTPVAIITSATMPEEKVLQTTLGSASKDAKTHAISSPAIVVVGAIAGLRENLASTLGGHT